MRLKAKFLPYIPPQTRSPPVRDTTNREKVHLAMGERANEGVDSSNPIRTPKEEEAL